MPEYIETNCLEEKIIEVAKALFIEKGFNDTCMSEIAARAGINRPVLHYYFRTKDRMFKAVFGMIVQNVLPKLQSIIQNRELSVAERVEKLVDIYYEVFSQNPQLPLFVAREINRDADCFVSTLTALQVRDSIFQVVAWLKQEMKEGHLKPVPLRILFWNLYSLLTFPFLTKELVTRVFAEEGETFETALTEWKPYIVSQIVHLLCPSH